MSHWIMAPLLLPLLAGMVNLLLVLDEATASLDPKSEAEICATVQRLRGRMTILAVSHQPALLDVADKVYRLEHGVVTEISSADERRALRETA